LVVLKYLTEVQKVYMDKMMENNTENTKRTMIFVDELSSAFTPKHEPLKEQIRAAEGVPNATYLVKDGKVFVFEKLVDLVLKSLEEGSQIQEQELATQLFPEAFVTASEAVNKWNIVPVPYETVEAKPGVYKIIHRAFNSALPGTYHSQSEINSIYANILLGKAVLGTGDFKYHGQEMNLLDNYNTSSLPSKPEVKEVEVNTEGYTFNYLDNIEYENGFTPISKDLFEDIKQLESSWNKTSSGIQQYVSANLGELWKLVGKLDLKKLNDPKYEVLEDEEENSIQLIALYPELSMLTPGTLYELYDSYQLDLYMRSWEADRNEDFVLFVLGSLSNSNADSGHWAAYSVLQGESLEGSIEFSDAAIQYTKAISKLASKTAVVMQYLNENKDSNEQRGPEIRTTADMFRISRKFGSGPIQATQVM